MLIATTGCDTNTSDTSDTDTITSSTDGAIDSGSIVAATVRVRADGCGPRTELGTGTAIADGLVVTAAHVVAGSSRVEVVDRSGTAVAAEVVVFDPELDVAALRPATDVGSPVPLRPVPLRAEMGQQGERGIVAVIDTDGAATPATVEVLQRVTIRTTDIYRDQPVERAGLRVDASVEPGDSGAMVHLPGGGVGIVWSRSTTSDDQAWTVDLPSELRTASTRQTLIDPVDVGRCL